MIGIVRTERGKIMSDFEFSSAEEHRALYMEIARDNIREGKWIQRDGTVINVRDMSDKHIRNTIAMLLRGNSIFKGAWIERFEKELNRREKSEIINARKGEE